jgi:energy-coupling factor transporter ATP-binding protein EcfA2
MLDFVIISTKSTKKGSIEVYPKFVIPTKRKSSDLMIRGGDFYAVWDEEQGMWSRDEEVALYLIDKELDIKANELRANTDDHVTVQYMWDSESGMVDKWHRFVQVQLRDSYETLDENIIFSNTQVAKTDYASKKLSYPLENGSIAAYDELMNVLYRPDERKKIEWAIGSIVSGDSKTNQKFLVLYGSAGTGKSTVLNIIQQLFEGYCSTFDAKALGSNSNSFALEALRGDPLVAIQHDGDLSRIEDNTRLNSVVSHELMTVNEKFKSAYTNRYHCFLFLGTNKPVKITDAKSGIIRRLIDVSPSGKKIPYAKYTVLMNQITFELGAIAKHCLDVYEDNKELYANYIPVGMLNATNDFYNFVLDNYDTFKDAERVSLDAAYAMYNTYCDEAKVNYPLNKRLFKEELKNYFDGFIEREEDSDGRTRSFFTKFKKDKFVYKVGEKVEEDKPWIDFQEIPSLFDIMAQDYPAQLANEEGNPKYKWANVKTTLSDVKTTELHFVQVPENHIVIDFDLKDKDGNKCLEKNIEAASKFPRTYAELSKSGQGIHLHYIYTGEDPTKLSRIYDDNIEVKVFTGGASLRRKLTKCNNLPVASINTGLPMKEVGKTVDYEVIKSEKDLRARIKRNLNKEIHGYTTPSIDFIKKILDDAYNQGLTYDVSDLQPYIVAFAAGSTHQSERCLKVVTEMKFHSEEPPEDEKKPNYISDKLVFFDVEVFPNLFVVVYKVEGEDSTPVTMINPSPEEIDTLCHMKLVGFNNRRYDNHILYARLIGKSLFEIYQISKRIIKGDTTAFFSNAWNLSYTDIYDFSSEKKSLKKFEIELGIHHQELGRDWDQPVPEDKWQEVADYCINDVVATEATFNARQADFIAREILADVADSTVNDTTNGLTTKIIFGKEKHPQLVYTDLKTGICTDPTYQRTDVINSFPEYEYEDGHNLFDHEDVGYGGYVYAEPGMYHRVVTLDVASMHPHSIIAMNAFGKYTKRFEELLNARIAIKHGDFESAKTMLNGKLAKYLDDKSMAKKLSHALKIAINSVYGLTAAAFDNPFRDARNVNNFVALRGALFMAGLRRKIQERGFTVVHIKTDSIKIADPTQEILDYAIAEAKKYGYDFEVEHIFERICLVNDAVYIAKLAEDDPEEPGKWTATGTQFDVPYVFKSLFSKEPIIFSDMCETKSVTSSIFLDMNESLPDVSSFEKEKDKLIKKNSDNLTEAVEAIASYDAKIAEGHDYRYIGKVGLFCPIKAGHGGGLLVRDNNGKYAAVNGSKGYRWLEAETVKNLHMEDAIDKDYYRNLCDKAVETISQFGNFEQFVA